MWLSAAAAADPGLPYQAIGVVLAALVTGITAIVVAILQRQRSAPPAPPAPDPAPTGTYVISELEWIAVRDRSLMTQAALEALRHEYNQHEQISSANMARMAGRLELVFRRQGGSVL